MARGRVVGIVVAAFVVFALALTRGGGPPAGRAHPVTCSAFSSQSAAQQHFLSDPAGHTNLDSDGDGIACEDNPPPYAPPHPLALVQASPTATVTRVGTPPPGSFPIAPQPGGGTATPLPSGPQPTPPGAQPTPPPGQGPEPFITGSRAAACTNVSLTWPDGTPVMVVAAAVTPGEALVSIWRYIAGTQAWQGFSPRAPGASDLATVNYLDAVYICMSAPGTLNRPPSLLEMAPPSVTPTPGLPLGGLPFPGLLPTAFFFGAVFGGSCGPFGLGIFCSGPFGGFSCFLTAIGVSCAQQGLPSIPCQLEGSIVRCPHSALPVATPTPFPTKTPVLGR